MADIDLRIDRCRSAPMLFRTVAAFVVIFGEAKSWRAPVTNQAYAAQIAREWNVPASGAGFVTRFQVRADFMSQYRVEKVGGAEHTEWWVPAEDLEQLNDNIVDVIEVVEEFR